MINRIKAGIGSMLSLKPMGEMLRTTTSSFSTYKLDSSKVDYKLARELYRNKSEKHKLGSAFAAPVVNTTAGFMGVPGFKCESDESQQVMDDFIIKHASKMMQTQEESLKLGDCYVWLTREERRNPLFPEESHRVVYNIIPPEQVKDIILDIETGEPKAYILEVSQEWVELDGSKKQATIKQVITNESRKIEVLGDKPDGIEEGEFPNAWGFIPIVHFKNEPDNTMKFGQSDLEPIEPYMKAYHDIMLHAAKGNKLHSNPKLKLKVADVAMFLRNNLGIDDPAEFAKTGGTISLDGKDILIMESDDDASLIEAKSATGDAKALLKLLFFCIVDTTEIPEFVFGVHTPSSLASVKEQMPVLINKIKRKREQFSESWQLLARMVLTMNANASGQSASNKNVVTWDEIDPRDTKDIAETLHKLVLSMKEGVENSLISEESAVQFLAEHIDTMSDYTSNDPEVTGERERIMRTRRMRTRFDDNEGFISEVEAIERTLGDSDE